MKFSKNLIVILSSTLFFAACGSGGDKPAASKDSTASTAPAASGTTASSSPADDKAIELIGASDCTTCHRLHQADGGSAIGPAYDQVATKYNPAADTTVDRLIKKIVSGGSGIWGSVPMTPHPALKTDDVKTMVTYILSLKK